MKYKYSKYGCLYKKKKEEFKNSKVKYKVIYGKDSMIYAL